MTVSEIRISALEHYEYCPRQAGLIEVEQQWMDNRHTIRGSAAHRRVDTDRSRVERGRRVLRGLPIWSERHGLVGRADVVEVTESTLIPVEYKSGRPQGRTAIVQLCAQALCLEEMFGVDVPQGRLWYSDSRRRIAVDLTDDLRTHTLDVMAAVRWMQESGELPPAENDGRCVNCQLEPRCIPNVVSLPERAQRLADEIVGGVP